MKNNSVQNLINSADPTHLNPVTNLPMEDDKSRNLNLHGVNSI